MRASEFLIEAIDTDAVNELDSFIMNDEDLYRRRFMPIISNIKRKLAKKLRLLKAFGVNKIFSERKPFSSLHF